MKTKIRCSIIIILTCFSIYPFFLEDSVGWNQDYSSDVSVASFSTHSWLAHEGLLLYSSPSKIVWLSNNIQQYWHGVEAPYNADICLLYDNISSENYGDIGDLTLKFDSTGSTVLNDSLATRAMVEYTKLITELQKEETNFQIAAFYAGAMTHYISQASSWFTLWNTTLWGTIDLIKYNQYETVIEEGLDATSSIDPSITWKHNYLELNPNSTAELTGYDATTTLGEKCYPFAESLQNLFIETSSVEEWENSYKKTVELILSYSVEAIYAALESAMNESNWKYLSIPDPIYNFDNETAHLEIPAFTVTVREKTISYNLNDSLTIQAKVYLVDSFFDALSAQSFPSISSIGYNLTFTDDAWSFPNQMISGLASYTNYNIIYNFQLQEYPPTWSNISIAEFNTEYYSLEISNFTANYNWNDWTFSVENISVSCPNIPEIGIVDSNDINFAEWQLYTTGDSYSQLTGVQAKDTEGNFLQGSLLFNETTEKWFSYQNDIGMVFNHVRQIFFICVRFNLTDVPVGTWNIVAGDYSNDYFLPFARVYSNNTFTIRNHLSFSSKPDIIFNAEKLTISAYNITAYVDYHNNAIDYYEIYERLYLYGGYNRFAKFRVLPDLDPNDWINDPPFGDLSWNEEKESWYFEDRDISYLQPGMYYVRCSFRTMNTNYTVGTVGSPSDIFVIVNPYARTIVLVSSVIILTSVIIAPIIILVRKKTSSNR